ncbi:META domain-containing protein [Sphingomicrobium clamense]|uniref:META domain-containing protein n=1 Tax=Sphingomicrobium clamense TaxID=2851013 RepID=A0ABS6V5Y8_9SPHN|nr:META domain-containing protein [Sphingomicrobium sp. B8]MBW0144961.1 META domain-containing protein [Sphingomicrobium sp. B8]
MKQLLPAALLALSLAACTQYGQYGDPYGSPYPQRPQDYPQPYPAPYPTPYPNNQPGVQEPYKASGTEPFWSLTIDRRDMRFEEMNGFSVVERTPPVEPSRYGDEFRGRRIEVTIRRERCSDGMSDRIYPDRVDVRVDGRYYRGCGAPQSMYGQGWEQGYPGDNYGGSAMLERTNWQVTALNGRQTPQRDFYLNFFPDNRLQAKFGCNTINAGYQQNGDRLTVGAQMMTRMGCPDMSWETSGSNVLSQPLNVRVDGDRLTLSNRSGRIEARRIR